MAPPLPSLVLTALVLLAQAPPPALDQILAWIETDRLDLAETELRRRVQIAGHAPAVDYLLGVVLLRQLRPVEAEASLRRAVDARPERALWQHALATALIDQGRCDAALAPLDAALARDPRPAWRYDKACCVLDLGETERARRELETVLAAEPEHLEARFRLGVAAAAAGEKTAAIAALRRVLETAPEHAGALYNLGRLLLDTGEHDAGKQLLERFKTAQAKEETIENRRAYLRLHPTDTAVRRELSRLLLEAGRREEAEAELRRARRLEENPP